MIRRAVVAGLAALAMTPNVLAQAAVAAATPAFVLPAPTGPYRVGTTVWHLADPSRRETLGDDPKAPREVEVLVWYPTAQPSSKEAPYLREAGEHETIAPIVGGAAGIESLAAVRTHSTLDATPIPSKARLPVLVFSPGFGGFASASTALAEDLASHGYAVLVVVHPYELGGATLSNGANASVRGADGKPRAKFIDIFAEWKTEDETTAAVIATTDVLEQRSRLKTYFAAIPKTQEVLRRWVDDTRAVLDGLSTAAPDTTMGRLVAQLDLKRLGVLGHSMGGVTAAQFCVEDKRCRAGLNLDGSPQFGTAIDTKMDRPFLMVYSARMGRAGASDVVYGYSARPYYRVDVSKTLHLDFSDMVFWGGNLAKNGALGSMAPERAARITRAIVLDYFDLVFNKKRSPLMSGAKVFDEVTVREMPPVRFRSIP